MSYKLTSGGQLPEYLDNVGIGWRPLLVNLHKELLEIAPDYQVSQVKEKWGTLRVYITGTPIRVDAIAGNQLFSGRVEDTATDPDWRTVQGIVSKYEKQSAEICEDCGRSGHRRNDRFWVRTLCDDCTVLRDVKHQEIIDEWRALRNRPGEE